MAAEEPLTPEPASPAMRRGGLEAETDGGGDREAAADGRVKTIEEALALARMLAAGERDLDGGALFEGL